MIRNKPTITKVRRKTSFSSPRLVNEVPPPAAPLPKPVPLAWISIKPIRIIEITI